LREGNNGTGESNILQNQFTAYLVTAIHRRKIQYIRSKANTRQFELTLEIPEPSSEPDMTLGLPLLEQLENARLRQALLRAKEREQAIFLAKALEDRSFTEIAVELGIGYNTAVSIYYRLINRLKKELGGGDP
jgi:RNA polymerase sigma factor (sigma-70 family)